jgi:hypothetical protein
MNLKRKRKVIDDSTADLLNIAKDTIAKMKSGEIAVSAQLLREVSQLIKRADDETRREELLGKPQTVMDEMTAMLPAELRTGRLK